MVTELVQLRSLAGSKREENIRFRRYLKAYHLQDSRFRAVAQRIEKAIDCTACANCCRETKVNVSSADIAALARYLRIDGDQAVRQYTVADSEPGQRILAQARDACVFLDGNLCLVYEARPRACRRFPWVDDDGRSLGARMSSMCDRASFCPIVYNALEDYKRLVGYHEPVYRSEEGGPMTNRREFLQTGSAALLAVPPASRPSGMKIALYGITFAGLWYRGRALTLQELIDRAREYGYDGIEMDGKRPNGYPPEMPRKRCQEIRKYAAGQGMEIFAVSANNDFSSPIPEHRQCQAVYLRELMRMTSDLGVKFIRVFLAWPGVTKTPGQGGSYEHARRVFEVEHAGYSAEQIWEWCREGMAESARYAREFGVTLTLQNHKPVINDYRDVLRMVREVDSPALKVCLDAPLMDDKSEAAIRKAAFEVGALQVMSHFGGEFDRGTDGAIVSKGSEIYPYFVRAMLDIGYRGHIGYELCHPLPVVDGNTVGIEFAEKNARLAAEFMRGVLAEGEKAPRRQSA